MFSKVWNSLGAPSELEVGDEAGTLEPQSWRDSNLVQGIGGFVAGLTVGFVPGGALGAHVGLAAEVLDPGTRASRIGLALGEMFAGALTTANGFGGVVGGLLLSGTGPGATVGVPVVVASAGVMTGALANVGVGYRGLLLALSTGGSAGVSNGPAAKAPYGGLSQAGKYGIKPYGKLRAELTGTGLKAHHLLPQRFADILKMNRSQMSSIAVTQAEHDVFTNAWRSRIPYESGTKNATAEEVLDAAREIYKGYPAILEALGL